MGTAQPWSPTRTMKMPLRRAQITKHAKGVAVQLAADSVEECTKVAQGVEDKEMSVVIREEILVKRKNKFPR